MRKDARPGNRTVYLSAEQTVTFLRGQKILQALGSSVGAFLTASMQKLIDQHAALEKAIIDAEAIGVTTDGRTE